MTTLPEHLVEGVYDKLCRVNGEWQPIGPNDIKEVLTAALPFLPVQVAVKKLEWANPYPNVLQADTVIGRWAIQSSADKWDWWPPQYDDESFAPKQFDTLEAAKAAAQADYEARILSALEPSAARELALEEAARNAAMYLATGFITCPRCGEDVETKNTDAEYTLRAALSSPGHADAGKVEGDGWMPMTHPDLPLNGASVVMFDSFAPGKDGFGQVIARFDKKHGWHVSASVVGGIYIKLTNPIKWRPLFSAPASEGAK